MYFLYFLHFQMYVVKKRWLKCREVLEEGPWSNAFWPTVWQAQTDKELTLSASPTTAVSQKALPCYNAFSP